MALRINGVPVSLARVAAGWSVTVGAVRPLTLFAVSQESALAKAAAQCVR